MSEMVEAVGRAIYERWAQLPMPTYEELARAAIQAMRSPTKGMVIAGDEEKELCIDSDWDSGPDGESHNVYTIINSDLPAVVYRAMIDAALNE